MKKALFIGHTYIDVTFLTDKIPSGDEKTVADDYAVSFGGNAVTAAFCFAKLAQNSDFEVELCTSVADDWLGGMFRDMTKKFGISLVERKVEKSALSFIMPKDGKRAIIRCRDTEYLSEDPELDLDGVGILHLDGHQPELALACARECRERGVLTSLDGGGMRANTEELLEHIDVAVCAERLCEQMDKTPETMLDYLTAKGVEIPAVTMGVHGMVWKDESGAVQHQAALPIPQNIVVDSSGAGDIFHGAYVFDYLQNDGAVWSEHFDFARGASAHGIQFLGNEASLPTVDDIAAVRAKFEK